jgi:tetratricopeptide (TPR) repeat protein
MYLKADDVTKALKFLNEAVELSDDNKQKADYLYQIGMIHLSNERFVQARSFALRAIEARPEWGMPYMLIGQAYALSANSIGSTEVEKKSAYWAAVDKFMKAKSVDPSIADAANEAIRTYSAHFPPINEVFFENLEEGQTYEVGGWINERTTVRARK